MKFLGGAVFIAALAVSGITVAGPISVGLSVTNNNDLHNAETLAAAHGAGSTATLMNSGSFNALTTAERVSTYDLLVLGWASGSSYNFDWATVIQPYLMAGGTVIWEDDSNLAELYAGSGLTAGSSSASVTSYTGEFGLNSFTGPHFGFFTSAGWDCVADNGTNCLVAKATFGAGRIIVSGADEFYHDNNAENDAYLFAQSEWLLAARVPEPTALALFGLGLFGLAGMRKRQS